MTASVPAKGVKCLVWDLDDTLWDGVVLENDDPEPFAEAVRTLSVLDSRGILHAAASRSEFSAATGHLDRRGLGEWFCAVQVGWGDKSAAVRRVAEALNIGLDTIAFIDNDPAERAEVAGALPTVRCYPAEQAGALPGLPEFTPDVVTAEAAGRRELYRTEWRRQQAEEESGGDRRAFLATLDLEMEIRRATGDDLARASELTQRTHQLNSTGLTYDAAELRELADSPQHRVEVAELRDRFGEYGIIGLALTELGPADAVLRLMLMSCRVASRGVGGVLLNHLVRRARADGLRPVAHFVPTEVNRTMLVTLRFAGFAPVAEEDGVTVLAVDPGTEIPEGSGHTRVISDKERTP